MTTPAGQVVEVTATFLEIPSRSRFRPALAQDLSVTIVESCVPLPAFYRFLYREVGHAYHWTRRLSWSDAEIVAFLSRPSVTLLVLYVSGTPAGYCELNAAGDEPGTEVSTLGLIGHFHGRGLGKHLLSAGVQRAFDDGAERIWVLTTSLDSPHALPNYRARGFTPYKSMTYQKEIPPAA